MTPKNLIPFLLLTAAVVFSTTAVRPKPVAAEPPVAEEEAPAPAVSHLPPPRPASPYPSGSAPNDAPLTDREQHDMAIRVPIQACVELGQKINAIAGIPDSHPKHLNAQIVCMRQGNIAWSRCIDKAQSKQDVVTCNRRLLH
ncbi:MAG TPA: hypothetical protein VIF09_00755 [Polyangiaceae bacterium]